MRLPRVLPVCVVLLALASAPQALAASDPVPTAPVAFKFDWQDGSVLDVDWVLEATQYEGESPWTLKLHDRYRWRVEARGDELEIHVEGLTRPEPVLWGLFPADFPSAVTKAIDKGYDGSIAGFRVSRDGRFLGLLERDALRRSFDVYRGKIWAAVPTGLSQTVAWQDDVDSLISTSAVERGFTNLWNLTVQQLAGREMRLGETSTSQTLEVTEVPGLFLNMGRQVTLVRQSACAGIRASDSTCVELKLRSAPTKESANAYYRRILKSHGLPSGTSLPDVEYRREATVTTHAGTLVPIGIDDRFVSVAKFGGSTVDRHRWFQRHRFEWKAAGTREAAKVPSGGPL